MKKSFKSGFTLIELLVVLVIIGALAAIAIPSYFNQEWTARVQLVENNLRAIAAAQSKFYEDYSSYCISTGANPTGHAGFCGDSQSHLSSNLRISMAADTDGFAYSCTAPGNVLQCTAVTAVTIPASQANTLTVDINGNLACSHSGTGLTCP
ncbi:MAG: prepilin-type N-terminal cleavage/methylation domain-containing protein [Candidatus Omnitrophica bacterium]|nr:prepilin-type N-terminal cleavage/methylation domain-containing protein [Candidatus Omnitrophota bacterium]